MLAEHGTVERPPLLEGRNMYIVMGPIEKRPDKQPKSEGETADAPAAQAAAPANGGDTIGDALAARGQAPTATVEPPAPAPDETQQPAEQG
jgi:hypothetical protein